MTISRKHMRFDIKEIAINQLEALVKIKCRTLKTDNVFFDPIDDICGINMKHGYFTLIKKNGKTAFPKTTKGSIIVSIIKTLKTNDFFSYIETKDGKHIKVKPRKNATQLQLPLSS